MRASKLLIVAVVIFGGCSTHKTQSSQLINHKASLPEALPHNPFAWRVISALVKTQDSTTSMLFGNDIAVLHARTNPRQPYPAGSVLSLVTWSQEEDDRWFGAKVPDELKSVEFVTVMQAPDSKASYSYDMYAGTPLRSMKVEQSDSESRINYLLQQRALVMPWSRVEQRTTLPGK